MHNKILVVTGMHRSGTSLITNWLHKCGLEVGEQLLGPALGNSEGHYEDVEFCKMHEEILRDNHITDTGIAVAPIDTITPYHTEKIKSIITVKNKQYQQWGWKDPRTCLFLDIYPNIIPEAYYFVITRDYTSVVTSLLKRGMAERDEFYNATKGYFSKKWYKLKHKRYVQTFYHQHAAFFLKVWMHYNENILTMLQRIPEAQYFVVNYNKLITNDDKVISYLNNQWGFTLEPCKFSSVYNERLLSKSLAIESYISDKQLIKSAKEIEERLQKYMQI